MFDISLHRDWLDFKAWLLHREDMERRAAGRPALEAEIAMQNAAIKTQNRSTPPN